MKTIEEQKQLEQKIEDFLQREPHELEFDEIKAIVKMNYEIYKAVVPKIIEVKMPDFSNTSFAKGIMRGIKKEPTKVF